MFDLTFLANKIMGAVAKQAEGMINGMLGTHVNPFRKAKK